MEKKAKEIALALARLSQLAEALDFYADQRMARSRACAGHPDGFYSNGIAHGYISAAASIRQALDGTSPLMLSPAVAKSYEDMHDGGE